MSNPRGADESWVRQYINADWPARDRGSSAIHDHVMRELHDDLRDIRDVHDVLMRVQRRYETALVEQQRLQQELAYYREMNQRNVEQLRQVAERIAPPPMVVGRIDNIRIMSQAEQEEFNRTPIHQIGVDWGRSPLDDTMVRFQMHTQKAILEAFSLSPEQLKDIKLEEKKPDATGRIIDLDS